MIRKYHNLSKKIIILKFVYIILHKTNIYMLTEKMLKMLKTDFKKFLLYNQHINENTIYLNSGYILQTIAISGISFETEDDETLEQRKKILNNIYKSLAVSDITIYIHTIRRKNQLNIKKINTIQYNNLIQSLQQEWNNSYVGVAAFENKIFISILLKVNNINSSNKDYFIKNLHNVSFNLLSSLNNYNAELLNTYNKDNNLYSGIVNFLYMLANGGEKKEIILNSHDISNTISNSNIEIFDDYGVIEHHGNTKLFKIITNSEYPKFSGAGILDGLLNIPSEAIITHIFKCINKNDAINDMDIRKSRLKSTADRSETQIFDIDDAIESLNSNEVSFGYHSMAIEVFGKTESDVNIAVSNVINRLINRGFSHIIESTNLEALFWTKFPGNHHLSGRLKLINSLNLSGMASLHMYPMGNNKRTFWGDYLTIFTTVSNTLYYFNFHVNDVGHTVIIGPTGAGKTVLLNFLCVQAQKFKPKMFFFDKDHGAEIFIRSIHGKYNVINPNECCDFNPLQLKDTTYNRAFLLEWLISLAQSLKYNPTSKDITFLNQAIEGNFKLLQQDRNLTNLMGFLETEQEDNITSKLKLWTKNESYGKVFDNALDKIDFEKNRIFGFEMQYLLDNKIVLPSVLLYLFHRINTSLDGAPTIIVLDEAWALINNDIFAPKIKNWLKILRKKNAIVIFATQSVEDAVNSSINATIIQQTATQIFFPNPKATSAYKTAFMLSNRELDLILNTAIKSRYFLIKQENNAVVAKLDLSKLQKFIYVLSGTTKNVNILNNIISEIGSDSPRDWLEEFYRQVSS